MSYVDEEYADMALSRCLKFRRVSGPTFKLQCRCPICGDSKKDENKARFWAKSVDDDVLLHCFNCEYTSNISRYLKEYEPDLYREYILEKRKFNTTFSPRKEQKKEEKKVIEFLPYSVRLDTLKKDHKLIQYIRKRKIPEEAYKLIYFTKEWQKLANHIKPNTFKYEYDEMRLVIPIFNSEGKIESIQGRSLKKDDHIKYMTIKAYESATKIYGIERIDESKPVIILEGPIDSLFVDNSIAITGGSLDLGIIPFQGNRIWALDNEPRHPDTLKRMKKLIKAGEKVVFWDEWKVQGKDINEFIINGASRESVLEYILNNNFSGLMAELRYSKFSKL